MRWPDIFFKAKPPASPAEPAPVVPPSSETPAPQATPVPVPKPVAAAPAAPHQPVVVPPQAKPQAMTIPGTGGALMRVPIRPTPQAARVTPPPPEINVKEAMAEA